MRYILFNLLLLLSCAIHADSIYVNGDKVNFIKSDFVKTDSAFTALVDVIGHSPDKLLSFQIKARVEGLAVASQFMSLNCKYWFNGKCTGGWEEFETYQNNFVIQMQVSCSGYSIGSDLKARNELSNLPIETIYRSLNLFVLQDKILENSCDQLSINILEEEVENIEDIELSVFLTQ